MTKKTLLRLVPIVVLLLVVILALPLIKPAAPRELDLFTTPQGTSQYGYAQQYAELLSGGGIEVQIIETEGVVDTLRRLGENDRAAAGFVESGIEGGLEDSSLTEDLVSLGSLAFEPLWLFVRSELGVEGLEDLQGRRVYLGPAESAGRAIATTLLKDSGIDSEVPTAEASGLALGSVAADLVQGRVDAAFVVGEMRSPVLSGLFETEGVEALSNQRAAAFTRLHPGLAEIDRDCASWRVPRMKLDAYFELRQAIHDLRERLGGLE